MKWINVNDELPEPMQFVLTYRPLAKGSGDVTCQKFISKIHGFDRWHNVTHWMPKPKEPND